MIRSLSLLALLAALPLHAAPREDNFGDPLPAGAILRYGTTQFAQCQTATFSPDGKIVATASDAGVSLWDAKTFKRIRALKSPKGNSGKALAFSADSKRLAVLGRGGPPVDIWNLENDKVVTFNADGGRGGGGDWRAALVFSEDSKTLVTSDGERIFHIDAATGVLRKQVKLPRDNGSVRSVAFSRDGSVVATELVPPLASAKQVAIWDAATGKHQQTIKVGDGIFESYRFSPDAKTLAVGALIDTERGGVRLALRQWELSSGKLVSDTSTPGRIWGLEYTKDGKHIVSVHNNVLDVDRDDSDGGTGEQSICVWDINAAEKPKLCIGTTGVRSAVISPNSKIIAWVCCDQSLRFADFSTGAEVHSVEGHRGPITDLKFTSDGKTLASASEDGSVRLWTADSGKPIRAFAGHSTQVHGLAFSHDEKSLASASGDHSVIVWNIADGKQKRTLKGERQVLVAAAFAKDSKIIVGGGKGGIAIWDADTGNPIERLNIQAVNRVLVSTDGNELVTACWQRFGLIFFNRKTSVERRLPLRTVPTSLDQSPDGKLFAVGMEYESAVYGWNSPEPLLKLPGYYHERGRMAFSPDGRYIASVGLAHRSQHRPTICVFELLTGKEIYVFKHKDPAFAVAFSPDGRKLATGGEDTAVLLWDLHNLGGTLYAEALSAKKLDQLWALLADPDPAEAYPARAALIHAPNSATDFLAKKLQPLPLIDADKIKQAIADLDSKSFAKREAAQKQLVKFGDLAESGLRELLAKPPSEEARQRAQAIVDQIRPLPKYTADELRTWRAIDVLEYINTPAARDLLGKLAKGNPDHFLTREAVGALKRMPIR